MKFGQALSVLEAALPDEIAAPYREHLTALQDSAPPMPTQTVRDQLTTHLGADWREHLVWLDGAPDGRRVASARCTGAGGSRTTATEREVAVKVQYPGAGEALMSDLRQLSRVARGVAPVVPRHRHQAARRRAAGAGRRRARLPPRGGGTGGLRRGVPRPPGHRRPGRGRRRRRGARDRVDGLAALAGARHPRGHPGGARPLRRALRPVPLRGTATHRHAPRRPAPRQLPHPARRRTAAAAASACSTSAPSRGFPAGSCPRRWVA